MDLKSITLYSNLTIDFFHLEEQSATNDNVFVNSYIPKLNNDSRALITFDNDNNLNGVADNALGYTFSVFKEENNSNQLEPVARIKEGSLSVVDYNVVNQNKYKYYIFKEDANVISSTNISNEAETCWWNWSLTGFTESTDNPDEYIVNPNDIWLFDLNLESADTVRNFNKTEYKNFTRYPKISSGKLNYATGSLTCLIGQIRNDKYYDTPAMLDAWNDFCNNGQLKLLKDRKGHSMIVEIMSSSSNTMDETVEQADIITFNWTQVDDTYGMTIIE